MKTPAKALEWWGVPASMTSMNSSICPTREAFPARLDASGAALTSAVKLPVNPLKGLGFRVI